MPATPPQSPAHRQNALCPSAHAAELLAQDPSWLLPVDPDPLDEREDRGLESAAPDPKNDCAAHPQVWALALALRQQLLAAVMRLLQ